MTEQETHEESEDLQNEEETSSEDFGEEEETEQAESESEASEWEDETAEEKLKRLEKQNAKLQAKEERRKAADYVRGLADKYVVSLDGTNKVNLLSPELTKKLQDMADKGAKVPKLHHLVQLAVLNAQGVTKSLGKVVGEIRGEKQTLEKQLWGEGHKSGKVTEEGKKGLGTLLK